MTRIGLALFVLMTIAQVASADVCVALDEQRDTLSPDDRRAAMISFGQALAKAGVQVTNQNCTTTYTIYNVKLGETISIYVIGPTGNREGRASKLDELPLVYEQLAHSLVTGEPMGTGGGNVDRTNATNDQMAPRRVASDNLKYIRLGYGLVTGKTTTTGPAFGVGWRYELDSLAVEVSAFDVIFATKSCASGATNCSSGIGLVGDWVRLSAFKYTNPLGNDTTYFGGGVGWGGAIIGDKNSEYSGSGIEGHLIGGYEMLRASTIRIFGEADVRLPFYKSTGDLGNGDRWVPSVSLSIGVGWGRSNTVAVVNR